MVKKILWLIIAIVWVYYFIQADQLNRLYLIGGALTWVGNVFLIKKSWIGWLLTAFAIICYTVAPALKGLWAAIFINGVTMVQKAEGIYKWIENGKAKV